jgi:hypothetical protein
MGWGIKYDLTQNKVKIFIYLHLITYFPNLWTYFLFIYLFTYILLFFTYIPTYPFRLNTYLNRTYLPT